MSGDSEKWIFVLGDKLPTIYDAATAVHSVSKKPKSNLRDRAIHAYALSLCDMWLRAFGENHVLSLRAIKNRLDNIMKDYHNKVYSEMRSTSKEHKGLSTCKPSLRHLNKNWRLANVPVKKHASKTGRTITNNDLLDIGKNMVDLAGHEATFYTDQMSTRICRISEEIDIEYEEEREMNRIAEIEESKMEEEEHSFINDDEFDESFTISTRSSPKKRIITTEKAIQVYTEIPAPAIRKIRDTSDQIKDTIATVSYRSGVSVPKARVAVQAVCEKLYDHKYYLELPKKLSTDAPRSKKPRSAEDYNEYKLVLPGTHAVNDYKHKNALHQEIDAANSLIAKLSSTKVTLHYDTTSRSRIDGEWPALIFNFLHDDIENCKMLRLRPLFIAYENREQIVKLIIETLCRLAATTNGLYTAKDMWTQIDAFMTDSVSKNLKIEYEIAKVLKSDHIPLHLLCKSHTCEKFDEMNSRCLIEIEAKCKLRDSIEQREPQLKSFLRQKRCIIIDVVIPALLKLVSRDADGRSSSLADEFELILEESGVYKTYSLYKERRFTKLGYSAGSLYDCIPQFKKLLERTGKNNLLTRACKLYLESDFILAGLKALSNFTYHVTMPYLNCIERCDQNGLVEILPKLYKDLMDRKLVSDSLINYHVPWTHVAMHQQKPTSELDKYLINSMCIKAAEGLEIQCSREYWDENSELRATAVHKLSPQERSNLPTENMDAERLLARFGKLAAQSAQHSNKFFKAKRIRDDLMLESKCPKSSVVSTKQMRSVYTLLDEMEIQWTLEQKEIHKKKVGESFLKSKRINDFVDILLRKCKEYGGPITTVAELKKTLKPLTTDRGKKILRQELQFQKVTHKRDYVERPELYKINTMSYEQMYTNLATILSCDDITEQGQDIVFQSEDEIMAMLNNNANIKSTQPKFTYQQPLAVCWDDDTTGKREWYIGLFLDENDDGTCRIDHLERMYELKDEEWKRPVRDDIQDVEEQQIIPCLVIGEWTNLSQRVPKYKLSNSNNIFVAFEKYLK